MKSYYLVDNAERGTFGVGESMAEAISNCPFTGSQDRVGVYLVSEQATVAPLGGVVSDFCVPIGFGKVMSDKARVDIKLGGDAPWVSSRAIMAVERIHNLMSGEEWTSDTLDEVAAILNNAGYQIEEPSDVD